MRKVANIWMPDGDNDWLADKHLNPDGVQRYQSDRIERALPLCRTRGLAIDVGAHVGLWTVQLAQVFDWVIAIEPIAENFECLQKNVHECLESSRATKISTINAAVSNTRGSIALFKPNKSISWTRFPPAGMSARSVDERVKSYQLDDLHKVHDAPCSLLKVDVEGDEYSVLLGANELIRKCLPVIVIEEKHDPEKRATKLLTENYRYKIAWREKNDVCFVP